MIRAKDLQRADAKKSEELEEIVERSDIKAGGPSSARTPGRLLQRHAAGKTAILSIAGIDIPSGAPCEFLHIPENQPTAIIVGVLHRLR